MRVVGKVPIYPGQDSIFGPDVAANLIGQRTKDGSLITVAEQTAPAEIWLTVEMNIRDENDIFQGKEYLVFGRGLERGDNLKPN